MISSSIRVLNPISSHEIEIFMNTFPYSLKSSLPDHRHRLCHILKSLMTRLKEIARAASRDAKNERKRLNATQAKEKSESLTKIEINPIISLETKAKENLTGICKWLNKILLGNIYPNSPFEREVLALDLLHTVFETLGENDPSLGYFYSCSMVASLLNIFVSSWDKSRILASDLLLKFPSPWPGYSDPKSIQNLFVFALKLSGSPRLRESDAGALIIRNIYLTYCFKLGWLVFNVNDPTFSIIETEPLDPTTNTSYACAQFILLLCSLLESRMHKLSDLFDVVSSQDETETSPCDYSKISLCNGLVLSLRYCIMDSFKYDIFQSLSKLVIKNEQITSNLLINDETYYDWTTVLNHSFDVVFSALHLSMKVVAEAASDVPFAPYAANENSDGNGDGNDNSHLDLSENTCNVESELEGDNGSLAMSKGPINSSTKQKVTNKYMFVNTNGFMGSAVEEEGDTSVTAVSTQKAVVGAWLLVKESTCYLSNLVLSSGSAKNKSCDNHSGFISNAKINELGLYLLDGLNRLKHMGAISETYNCNL